MWIECNPNPDKRSTTDCAVRALALALTIPWDDAYLMLVSKGLKIHDMPDRHPVVHAVLKDLGYKREAVPNTCPECYSIEDFCRDHPKGVFFVGFGGYVRRSSLFPADVVRRSVSSRYLRPTIRLSHRPLWLMRRISMLKSKESHERGNRDE